MTKELTATPHAEDHMQAFDDDVFSWAIKRGFCLLRPEDWELVRAAMELEKRS